jgi:hypothetical protein
VNLATRLCGRQRSIQEHLKSWAIETRIFERYVQAAGAPLKILVSKSHHCITLDANQPTLESVLNEIAARGDWHGLS